jgi:glycosyltransferase involved in cell wall biosynthesis
VTISALKVQGPFKGMSGHDHHTREFVRALHRLGVAIELVDLPIWGSAPLPGGALDPLFLELSKPVDAPVFLRFGMPHQVLVEPELLNVNYTMFEATRIHRSWVAQARIYDLVVVPNDFCREVWVASGAPRDRVEVCPLGIDAELFARPAAARPLPLSRRVRFLNISESNRRKNLGALARVWRQATTADDEAMLVVKLATDAAGLEEFRAQIDGAAPVVLIADRLPDAEMPSLYAAATHYISTSLGEAWDLPMMEAAASGLELVAPSHSGYLTYLDPDSAHLVESREVPVELPETDDNYALFHGASWWRPDEHEAVAIVRSIVDGTAPPKPPPRERVLEQFSWDAAARRLLGLLSGLERRPARRRRLLRRASRTPR